MARLQAKDAEDQAKILSRRLNQIQVKLERLVTEVAGTSDTSATYWLARQREAKALYEEMRAITKTFITSKIPIAYDESVRDAIRKLKATEFTPNALNYNEFSVSHVYTQGLSAIISDSLNAFANAYGTGETQFLRLMRYTQQVNLTEKQVNKAIEDGYIDTGSPHGTAARLRDELLKKFKDGEFVTIVDKNGVTRQYNVDAYAEMVARTKLIEATTAGVVSSTLDCGGDLVQISAHNTLCEVCQEYEGKIYSITGNDPDFPDVTELPPFHPNCQHTVDSTFRAGMEAQGTLQDFIDFSNGDSETHPTRKSFIPISQRKDVVGIIRLGKS